MFGKGEIAAACVTGVILGAVAGGCVVVVDGSDESSWAEHESRGGKPKIGVYTDEPGRTLAAQLQLDRGETTVITDVVNGSPAERAGLRKYDVITAIDGDPSADPSDLRRAIRAKNWGDALALSLIRDGQPMDVIVTIDRPEERKFPTY